jgi:ADP-heptose:LPS heptosyltransferase
MANGVKINPGDELHVAAPLNWREACFCAPALRALKRYGVDVTLIHPNYQRNFWELTGFGDGIVFSESMKKSAVADLLHGVRSVLLWEAGIIADACTKADIPLRLGIPCPSFIKRLTHTLDVPPSTGPVEHRVRHYLDTVEALGAKSLVAENFAPVKLPVVRVRSILLVPDSDYGRHYEWPLSKWVDLIGKMASEGAQLVIATNGPLGKSVAAECVHIPQIDLMLPALEELAKHQLCIAADGTIAHLAGHVGTRCVVLFGPGEPEWSRPIGRHHGIARRKAECAPCYATKCQMDLRCQKELTVNDVLSVIVQTIS